MLCQPRGGGLDLSHGAHGLSGREVRPSRPHRRRCDRPRHHREAPHDGRPPDRAARSARGARLCGRGRDRHRAAPLPPPFRGSAARPRLRVRYRCRVRYGRCRHGAAGRGLGAVGFVGRHDVRGSALHAVVVALAGRLRCHRPVGRYRRVHAGHSSQRARRSQHRPRAAHPVLLGRA